AHQRPAATTRPPNQRIGEESASLEEQFSPAETLQVRDTSSSSQQHSSKAPCSGTARTASTAKQEARPHSPREDRVSPTAKKGKQAVRSEHRHQSPQGLKLMTMHAPSSSHAQHGNNRGKRSPTPPRYDNNSTPSLEGSDEEATRCPLSRGIIRSPIPSGFEKPPSLGTYDGQTDPDEHVDNINTILDFRRVSGAIRCRLFPTTLRKEAMAWYQSLAPQSVSSWKDLTEQFCRHFTASRRHSKTVATLEAIYQVKDESLRNYIERFNKEAVQVNTTDDMKKYLLERGLRPRSDFAKVVGIEKPRTLDELLAKAQAYMQYEEVEVADAIRHSRLEDSHPAREPSHKGGDKKRNDRPREPRGPPSTFTNYTPLIASRETILAEVATADFRASGIKFPKQVPLKPYHDRNKYCRYHKLYDHVTEECIQLKDAIEIMIRDG
ncbi:hypothetical protein A2U01_0002263, partial [Trifolium medium]|nr:hypothetical protein [Trifolium medium]